MSKIGSKKQAKSSASVAVNNKNGPAAEQSRDVMALFGSLRSPIPYDPQEKQRATAAMGRHAARKLR